jgi:hypothetical protein
MTVLEEKLLIRLEYLILISINFNLRGGGDNQQAEQGNLILNFLKHAV